MTQPNCSAQFFRVSFSSYLLVDVMCDITVAHISKMQKIPERHRDVRLLMLGNHTASQSVSQLWLTIKSLHPMGATANFNAVHFNIITDVLSRWRLDLLLAIKFRFALFSSSFFCGVSASLVVATVHSPCGWYKNEVKQTVLYIRITFLPAAIAFFHEHLIQFLKQQNQTAHIPML